MISIDRKLLVDASWYKSHTSTLKIDDLAWGRGVVKTPLAPWVTPKRLTLNKVKEQKFYLHIYMSRNCKSLLWIRTQQLIDNSSKTKVVIWYISNVQGKFHIYSSTYVVAHHFFHWSLWSKNRCFGFIAYIP